MQVIRTLVIAITVGAVCGLSKAYACPAVHGLPDYNCDGVFTISFFGDSILRGRTDPLYDGTNGSVPLRLNRRLKQSLPAGKFKVLNFSAPGKSCSQLLSSFRIAIRRDSLGVTKSDVAIFNCGINDYLQRRSFTSSFANLVSMQTLGKKSGIFSIIANVSQTRSQSMQRWIDILNARIRRIGWFIRFDLLNPQTMLRSDNIHPNGDGFAFMFSTFYAFLTDHKFIKLGEEQLGLTDADADGVYDSLEERKFNTNPLLSDTDGDLLSDGSELFTFATDPLTADTDGDGVDDYSEIERGTDPVQHADD